MKTKKLLGLIAFLAVVDGLILFFYRPDSSPPLLVVFVFFACLALIVAGVISLVVMLVYRFWFRWCTLRLRGKHLCMVWLIIIAFVLISLLPPVYNPKVGWRSEKRQNSFAFLFAIPNDYRISYRTLLVEWAIAIAIPVGVIITLRIKNLTSE